MSYSSRLTQTNRRQASQEPFKQNGFLLRSNRTGNFSLPPPTATQQQLVGPNPYLKSASTVRVTPVQAQAADPYGYMDDLIGVVTTMENDPSINVITAAGIVTAAGAAVTTALYTNTNTS